MPEVAAQWRPRPRPLPVKGKPTARLPAVLAMISDSIARRFCIRFLVVLRMVLASPRARFHANGVCIPVRRQLLLLKPLARLGPARLERPLADIVVIRNCAITCKIDKI